MCLNEYIYSPMAFHEPIPTRPSSPASSPEGFTSLERVRAAIEIQRRLAEEWIDGFEMESPLPETARDAMAMKWMKKYSVVFRAEFDEYTDDYTYHWQRGVGWVWLSNLQTRLDERLKNIPQKRVN